MARKKKKRRGLARSYARHLKKYSKGELKRLKALQNALNGLAQDMAFRAVKR